MPLLFGLLILGLTLLFIAAGLLQWLWNETMPELFTCKYVTYWQAFRLLLIAAILIGGPGLLNVNLSP